MRIGTLTYILLAIVGASVGSAQALEVDWKYYGGAPTDDGESVCFFDVAGIVREPDSHMRVWTKCLLQKDIEGIDIKNDFDGRILEDTAKQVAHYYVPPIAAIETVNVDQAMEITRYEETADIASLQPSARIFYELNCPERMMRELSIYIQTKGKIGSIEKPSQWKYVPPEGNGARLLKILCPLQ
jgi:hypothetical protein